MKFTFFVILFLIITTFSAFTDSYKYNLSKDLDEIVNVWPLHITKLIINDNSVNIRSGPGIQFEILNTLAKGTIIEFISQEESITQIVDKNGRWIKVKTNNQIGYIFSAYCDFYICEANKKNLSISFYPDLYGSWKPTTINYDNQILTIEYKWKSLLSISTKKVNNDIVIIDLDEHFESIRSKIHNVYILYKDKLFYLSTFDPAMTTINGIVNTFILTIELNNSIPKFQVEQIASNFSEWKLTNNGFEQVFDYP